MTKKVLFHGGSMIERKRIWVKSDYTVDCQCEVQMKYFSHLQFVLSCHSAHTGN
jgi:hypothetical protein